MMGDSSGEIRVDTLKNLADLMAYRTKLFKDFLELNVRIDEIEDPESFQKAVEGKRQLVDLAFWAACPYCFISQIKSNTLNIYQY